MSDLPEPLSDLDDTLMAEVEEIFRHQLAARERDGLARDELQQLANRYYQMFELLDNGIHRQPTPWADRTFRDETYHFIADGFMDRLHALYDDSVSIGTDRTHRLIEQTRHKLHRIRRLLEC